MFRDLPIRQAIANELQNLLLPSAAPMPAFEAGDGGEEMAEKLRYAVNGRYLETVRTDDYMGVQTYSRFLCGPDGLLPPPNVEQTQMGHEFYPEALENTIREAVSVAQIPVIVTEHGVATRDDNRRIDYLRRALQSLTNCIADGLDVRGYYNWSHGFSVVGRME